MLFKLSTTKTVSEAAADLRVAIEAHYFGLMHVHDLKETMAKKGVEFAHQCLIFEVCQPQQAKTVLEANLSISTALPCRISIYDEGGKTVLATLKPTALLAMFNTPQLETVAAEVENAIVAYVWRRPWRVRRSRPYRRTRRRNISLTASG